MSAPPPFRVKRSYAVGDAAFPLALPLLLIGGRYDA